VEEDQVDLPPAPIDLVGQKKKTRTKADGKIRLKPRMTYIIFNFPVQREFSRARPPRDCYELHVA
jgi:hypothetical protein